MDQNHFKEILSRYPTGVTIVTTFFEGKEYGLTANSVASVSLEPPLLLFCINKNSMSYNALCNSDNFAINFLASHQEDLAINFATPGASKFMSAKYTKSDYEIPVFDDAVAYIILKNYKIFDAGDHSIIIGRTQKGYINQNILNPLGYINRKFVEIK